MANGKEEPGTAVAVVGTTSDLRGMLDRSRKSLADVLPAHMTADRLIKLAVLAAVKEPKLLQCTKESVIASLMTAAQLGLEPNGTLGSAYLVPFNNRKKQRMECQLIPGYRGLIDLAKRSGEVSGVEARVVYEGDKFEPHYGTEPKIIHIPNFAGERKFSNILAVYVVATFEGGNKQFEIMSKTEVEAIRARSQAKDEGPWQTDFEEMAKKTVTKRASKYWPLSPEKAAQFAAAVEHDNRIESGQIGGIDLGRDTEASIAASVQARTEADMDGLRERMAASAPKQVGEGTAAAEPIVQKQVNVPLSVEELEAERQRKMDAGEAY